MSLLSCSFASACFMWCSNGLAAATAGLTTTRVLASPVATVPALWLSRAKPATSKVMARRQNKKGEAASEGRRRLFFFVFNFILILLMMRFLFLLLIPFIGHGCNGGNFGQLEGRLGYKLKFCCCGVYVLLF